MSLHRAVLVVLLATSAVLVAQKKYSGPRPPKPDLPYLLHASNLVATESGEAREEKRKDDLANIVSGAASNARTPLAEPILLIANEKLVPEKIELYRMTVKSGNREVVIPANPKKRREVRPIRITYTKVEPGLYRLEAAEALENGEYCLSPADSRQVFCFQVY